MKKVVAARANDDYSLDIQFDDGDLRRFDIKPYLEYGIFTELKNKDYFRKVKVAYGTVQWPNEQDISPETLYLESVALNEPALV